MILPTSRDREGAGPAQPALTSESQGSCSFGATRSLTVAARKADGAVGSDPLVAPVESLAGVGPTRAKHFHALGVHTLGDLLEYFPRDYQHESAESSIAQLTSGPIQTARGTVVAVDYVPIRPRPRFEATLDDGTGKLALVWFHGAYLRRTIHPGMTIRVKGSVKFFRNIPQMANPKFEAIESDTPSIESSAFRPVYPATARLPSDVIGRIIKDSLDAALPAIHEWFEPQLLEKHRLISRPEAYRSIHAPKDLTEAMRARRRIIYDELMLMQLGLGLSKRLRDGRLAAPVLRFDKLLDERIRRRFPFDLTDAQVRSIWEILHDLQSGRPMNRLLQGDVGSGKTVVALYAMLVAVANKMQSALLAPTEVLAEQHSLTLFNLLRDSSVRIELFTNRTKRQSKGKLLRDLAEGRIHIAVGTQALIQQDIEFANLGLVVVDEQHKLGVRQRGVLKGKGLSPHYLVMTATPIPRTLALSYFADFDVSTIDALPPGRQPIQTKWLRTNQAAQAYDFIRHQVAAGRQAYIVLPQIEDQGLEEAKSVKKEFERLTQGPLKGLRLAMLHGQMTTEAKHAIMSAFRGSQSAVGSGQWAVAPDSSSTAHRPLPTAHSPQIDVLIATTVIEVGIDVPNATVMLIDNADRFGLSQLHQLRGRVGRGGELSHCLLLADVANENTEQRLRTMTRTSNGFDIAEMDLQLRGPGEFFGTRQHGLPEFKLADITSELSLLQQAKDDALHLLTQDPRLNAHHHRHLRTALIQQFGDALPLAQIG